VFTVELSLPGRSAEAAKEIKTLISANIEQAQVVALVGESSLIWTKTLKKILFV
jgi:methyl-accepting chemotaxis protein